MFECNLADLQNVSGEGSWLTLLRQHALVLCTSLHQHLQGIAGCSHMLTLRELQRCRMRRTPTAKSGSGQRMCRAATS